MSHNFILARLARILNVDSAGTPLLTRQIASFTATVGGNALTITLPPTVLEFRSTTGSLGTPNVRVVSSNITLTVPSGATLGTLTNLLSRLTVLAIDNAGTVELAVINASTDFNLDETNLINTNTLTSGSNSAATVYSATGRAGVPFRVLGFIDSVQGTPGTWASAPTLVQGVTSHNPLSLINPSLAGMCAFFAMSSPPPGWLKANGAAISRTTYAPLFGKIGATFGGGNGSTTFNVPDLRGEFMRAWDDGRGLDGGRGFGDVQGGQNLIHSHGASAFVSDPGHAHITSIPIKPNGTGAGPYAMLDGFSGITGTQGIATDVRGTGITVGVSIANDGGGEARPRNVSLLACIKY